MNIFQQEFNADSASGSACSQNLNFCTFAPSNLLSAFFARTKAGALPSASPTITYHVCTFTFLFIVAHRTSILACWAADATGGTSVLARLRRRRSSYAEDAHHSSVP